MTATEIAPTTAGGATAAQSPTRPPRTVTLRQHLNLTRELAITQFKLKYTGSVLGYVWSMINPLMQFAILYVIFVGVFHADRSSPHFTLQLLLGIVIFNFFAETTNGSVGAIAGNGHMIRKAYFPRIILVLASSVTSFLTLGINFAVMLVFAVAFGQLDLGWQSLLTPLFLVELYLFCLGLGLLLSSLFVFYRDLGHIWGILTQVLFYGSAVMFPLSLLKTFKDGVELHHWRIDLLLCNPIAQIIEDMRHALITSQVPWSVREMGGFFVVPFLIIGVLLLVGWRTFDRLTPRFAESL